MRSQKEVSAPCQICTGELGITLDDQIILHMRPNIINIGATKDCWPLTHVITNYTKEAILNSWNKIKLIKCLKISSQLKIRQDKNLGPLKFY